MRLTTAGSGTAWKTVLGARLRGAALEAKAAGAPAQVLQLPPRGAAVAGRGVVEPELRPGVLLLAAMEGAPPSPRCRRPRWRRGSGWPITCAPTPRPWSRRCCTQTVSWQRRTEGPSAATAPGRRSSLAAAARWRSAHSVVDQLVKGAARCAAARVLNLIHSKFTKGWWRVDGGCHRFFAAHTSVDSAAHKTNRWKTANFVLQVEHLTHWSISRTEGDEPRRMDGQHSSTNALAESQTVGQAVGF